MKNFPEDWSTSFQFDNNGNRDWVSMPAALFWQVEAMLKRRYNRRPTHEEIVRWLDNRVEAGVIQKWVGKYNEKSAVWREYWK